MTEKEFLDKYKLGDTVHMIKYNTEVIGIFNGIIRHTDSSEKIIIIIGHTGYSISDLEKFTFIEEIYPTKIKVVDSLDIESPSLDTYYMIRIDDKYEVFRWKQNPVTTEWKWYRI